MTRLNSSFVCVSLLLCACVKAGPPPVDLWADDFLADAIAKHNDPPARPITEPLALRFGWEPDRRAQVLMHMEQFDEQFGMTEQNTFTSSFGLYTAATESGLELWFDGIDVERSDFQNLPSRMHLPMGLLTTHLALMMPPMQLDAGGSYTRLTDAEAYGEALRKRLDSLIPEEEKKDVESMPMFEMLNDFMSASTLESLSGYTWWARFGMWNDRDFASADTVIHADAPPIETGVLGTLMMDFDLSVRGWVPCSADDAETRCVRLAAHGIFDPDMMLNAVESMAGALPDGFHMDGGSTYYLTVDPTTMTPYSLFEAESAVVTLRDGRKSTQLGASRKWKALHFDWTPIEEPEPEVPL